MSFCYTDQPQENGAVYQFNPIVGSGPMGTQTFRNRRFLSPDQGHNHRQEIFHDAFWNRSLTPTYSHFHREFDHQGEHHNIQSPPVQQPIGFQFPARNFSGAEGHWQNQPNRENWNCRDFTDVNRPISRPRLGRNVSVNMNWHDGPSFEDHWNLQPQQHEYSNEQEYSPVWQSFPWQENVIYPLRIDNQGIVARPSIWVIPKQPINFTSQWVQFTIQVSNDPGLTTGNIGIVEAVVMAPSGKPLKCNLKEGSLLQSSVRQLYGCFRSNQEIGSYQLRSRAIFPLASTPDTLIQENYYGAVGDVANLVISRNYYVESRLLPAISFTPDCMRHPAKTVNTQCKPWGISFDPVTNRIYYSDKISNVVGCMDEAGNFLFVFKHQQYPASQLNRPSGLCCDVTTRRVAVCDKDNHRVCFFSMDGDFLSSFGREGTENGMFQFPWDIAINADGTRIVVSDLNNQRLQLFDANGVFINKVTPPLEANRYVYKHPFGYPRGVAFDPDGIHVYAADVDSGQLYKLSDDFKTVQHLKLERRFIRPQGLAVDSIGNILIADSKLNGVCHMSYSGAFLSTIKHVGGKKLCRPVNVFLMRHGTIGILDSNGEIFIL